MAAARRAEIRFTRDALHQLPPLQRVGVPARRMERQPRLGGDQRAHQRRRPPARRPPHVDPLRARRTARAGKERALQRAEPPRARNPHPRAQHRHRGFRVRPAGRGPHPGSNPHTPLLPRPPRSSRGGTRRSPEPTRHRSTAARGDSRGCDRTCSAWRAAIRTTDREPWNRARALLETAAGDFEPEAWLKNGSGRSGRAPRRCLVRGMAGQRVTSRLTMIGARNPRVRPGDLSAQQRRDHRGLPPTQTLCVRRTGGRALPGRVGRLKDHPNVKRVLPATDRAEAVLVETAAHLANRLGPGTPRSDGVRIETDAALTAPGSRRRNRHRRNGDYTRARARAGGSHCRNRRP